MYAHVVDVLFWPRQGRVGKNDGKWEEKLSREQTLFFTQTVLGRNFINTMLFLMRKNGRNILSKSWIDLCTLYFSTRLFRDLNEDVLRWILQFCIFSISFGDFCVQILVLKSVYFPLKDSFQNCIIVKVLHKIVSIFFLP